MTVRTNNSRLSRFLRKQLIMPTEHGSWSWLLVPYGVGAAVGGTLNLPLVLTLLAGLSAFFMRQPATVWLRVRRGRARAADGRLAAVWISLLSLLALVCLLALLALDRAPLLWLLGPLVVIFVLYLLAARYGRTGLRSLWMEITGASALAMMAPAALISIKGAFTGEELTLWILVATQNVLGALYVRRRVNDTHDRRSGRGSILWSHALGLGVVMALAILETPPIGVAMPFIAFLARAVWTFIEARPILNIKRFGFTEMGIEIVSGAWIAAVYWMA